MQAESVGTSKKEPEMAPPFEPNAPSFQHQNESVPLARPYDTENAYQPPAHGAGSYLPPSRMWDVREDGYVYNTLRLFVFHALNVALGFTAFTVLWHGVALGSIMLPLCCLGLLVFRVLLHIVNFFAELDVSLYNFVSPPAEQVYTSLPDRLGLVNVMNERLSPTLDQPCLKAMSATVYFCTIKFANACMSAIALAIALGIPVSAMTSPDVGSAYTGFFRAILFIISASLLFVIGVAIMHGAVRASRLATRYFCCEKFETYRYVHEDQYNHPSSSGQYGATNARQVV